MSMHVAIRRKCHLADSTFERTFPCTKTTGNNNTLLLNCSINVTDMKISYHKEIAHQHSRYKNFWAGLNPIKLSSYLVWQPCKIWLLSVIPWDIYVGDPKNVLDVLGTTIWDVSDPLETRPSSTCYVWNLVLHPFRLAASVSWCWS